MRSRSLEAGDLEPDLAAAFDGGGAGAAAGGLDDDCAGWSLTSSVAMATTPRAAAPPATSRLRAGSQRPEGRLVGAIVVVVMTGLLVGWFDFDDEVGGRSGASGDPLSRIVRTLIAITE